MNKKYFKELLGNKKTLKNLGINVFIWITLSFLLVFLGESFHRGSIENGKDFLDNQITVFLLNYLIFLMITSIAFFFKKTRMVYGIISTILMGFYMASGVITGFRGTPLIWADMFSFKEGLAIAGNYLNLNILKYAVIALVIIIAILVFLWFSERYKSRNKVINPYGFIIFPLSIFAVGAFYGNAKGSIEVYRWDLPVSYERNGFIYSFLDTAAGFKVKEPSDYNKASIEKIKNDIIEEAQLASNDTKMASAMPAKFPNIIIVQLESFMDLHRINGLTFKEDPIPTFRKISSESTNGFLKVPTYGGGTVRSEFEVLTGLSTDYLPVGEIPNNNILKKQPVESLAYILHDYGYGTNVIHNYEGNFYNRDTVYPNLGFDKYISMEYMDKPNNQSWQYPEDVLNIKPIEDIISNNEKPQFIYNVTVESHGGYSSSDFKNYTVDGNLDQEEKNELQCYIDKLRGVDEYIKELLDYVESSGEPTVIAMFGDHLPSLKIINDDESVLKDGNKYLADFFIWDNIGLPKENINMEAEEFTTYILEKLNMVAGVMPTFHNACKDDEHYKEDFELLQYDMLFGNKYILNENKNKYEKTNMKMGLKEITLNNYDIKDDILTVTGDNFNYKSKIIINGKIKETNFIDENTLTTTEIPSNIKSISVGQIGKYDKILSSSNSLEIK
ncbi:Lipoteichoic acid synthase [Clostridium perfringens]|uniref:LTA synthase family protein n=1 Tax=Clostridium perfringens TaxID=1502 RepID=UPI002444A4F7|nr:LTA synthase family protein [Clostridium perfringens]MDG6884865.1 Lipoteichoic acid synthase [Clostridium perfringens]